MKLRPLPPTFVPALVLFGVLLALSLIHSHTSGEALTLDPAADRGLAREAVKHWSR